MISVMNDYILKITLKTDDVTKSIFENAFSDIADIKSFNVMCKSNRYIVDVKLDEFDVEKSIQIMNCFMESTRFHYSAYFLRFNEGNLVRYRFASCKENREGFYCDVVIS